MADYINRADILFELETGFFPQSVEYTEAVSIAKAIIKGAPGVDAVEVVRCKDCEYGEVDENGNTWCTFYNGKIREMPDGYCWHGERKDG